jgi:ribonuclease HII
MPKSATRVKKDKTADKLENLKRLLAFDRSHRYKGRSRKPQCFIAGTDEVGRGCFAGPVVAAAVMLPEFDESSLFAASLVELNDSKKLTPAQRESLAKIIHAIAICEIEQSSVEEINELNILHASLLAMKRALDKLSQRIPDNLPVLVLVDGNKSVKGIHSKYVQTTVIDGDATSASIAAASIIAKVHRDRMMVELANQHPQYGWERNKGYGSRLHRDALKVHGMTPWHRRLFCDNLLKGEYGDALDEQFDDYFQDVAVPLLV